MVVPYGSGLGQNESSGGGEWPWTVRIMPYLEQDTIYTDIVWHENGAGGWFYKKYEHVVSAQISSFLCPSDPGAAQLFCLAHWVDEDGWGRMSYGGNFGIGQQEAGELNRDIPGVRIHGVFKYNHGDSVDDIEDGTSHTALVAEIIVGQGPYTIRGVNTYDEGPVMMFDYTPNDRTPDIVRWCGPQDDITQNPRAIAPCIRATSTQNMILHTARSLHPGGVQVGLCDGSVRFVNEMVRLNVWQALATPRGGEVLSHKDLD
jgi:prepilin-type processing-associated H-X9-DG protein